MEQRRSVFVTTLIAGLIFFGARGVSSGSLEDGGHTGTCALGDASAYGVGGADAVGGSNMIGGEHTEKVCSEKSEPLAILFLGNSYTHFFEMPRLFEGLAESGGCRVHVNYVAPGGSRLKRHTLPGNSLAAIGERNWDYVVLQNFSQLPSQPLEVVNQQTVPHVRTLVDAIRHSSPQAQLLFYVTWGRRDGDVQYCRANPIVCTFRGHSEALHRGYSLYQRTFGGELANVGRAFSDVSRDRNAPFSFRELYESDGSHPSLKGAYLTAAVFFSTIFRASPEGLAYPADLSVTSARYLQRVAGAVPVTGA